MKLHRTLSFVVLLFAAACKKDSDNTKTISFEQLGDTRLNSIGGYAMNGDPLGWAGQGGNWQNLRYRQATGQWERVGANATTPSGIRVSLIAEDADGTYYGSGSSGEGLFELRTGATAWTPLQYNDNDSFTFTGSPGLFVNSGGLIVVQANRKSGSSNRTKIFMRNSGTTAWKLVNDRPQDDASILQLTDQGDVFVQSLTTLSVLQNGSSQLKPVFACNGTVVVPYCGFYTSVAANGDMLLSQGGIGSPKLYKVNATQSYPTTANYIFEQTDEVITRGCSLLSNGTLLATGNDGGYGSAQYFFRRPGADNWQHAPEFPGYGYVVVSFNRQSQVYTTSRQSAGAEGNVYRVNY